MLQSMFQDKGDPLSMYDGDGPSAPGARKKEKDVAPPFDPKAALASLVSGLGARARGFLRALAARAMFAGVFVAVPMAFSLPPRSTINVPTLPDSPMTFVPAAMLSVPPWRTNTAPRST